MFQFQLVRLQSQSTFSNMEQQARFNSNWFDYSSEDITPKKGFLEVSIPTGSITVLNLLIIASVVNRFNSNWLDYSLFSRQKAAPLADVSIPTGSITVGQSVVHIEFLLSFQFQLVRLQLFASRQTALWALRFNSNWFDYSFFRR